MNYIFDSANELNNSFFILFAHLMDTQIETGKICKLLNINQKSIRQQIIHFTEKYTISSEPEYAIKNSDGSKQIPDIFLRINTKQTEEDIAFIIIENKINKSAIKKGQLEKQYNYFTMTEEYDENKPVYSILISPGFNIDLYHQTGQAKNTQILGREIISRLIGITKTISHIL